MGCVRPMPNVSRRSPRSSQPRSGAVDRLVAEHLAGRKGEQFSARISGVTTAGVFVLLPEYGADGFIPISTLGDDYYIYDEPRHAVIGQKSGRGFQLGNSVDVRLVEVAPLAGAMCFEMVSDPFRLPGSSKSLHKAKRGVARGAKRRARPTGGRRK